MLTISCPHCSCAMQAEDRFAGKKAKCGKCGGTFVIPACTASPLEMEEAPLFASSESELATERAPVAEGEWHYARDGQRLGPVSILKLKELTVAGALRPEDLVWKPGMPDWVPARQVGGLIDRSSPPPLPPSTGRRNDGTYLQARAPINQVAAAPALWNPGAAGIWSLFLPWGMGALLVALNWRALGEARQADRAMRWFYAALVFMGLLPIIVILQGPRPLVGVFYIIGNPLALLIWNWAECERQRKLLKQLFDNHYPRRWLIFPIVATIVLFLGWLVMAGAIVERLTSK